MDHALGTYDSWRVDHFGQYWWPGPEWPPRAPYFPFLDSLVVHEGYAVEPTPWSPSPRSLNWAYPELEGRDAYHFASSVFGRRHSLFLLVEEDESFVIGFCPQDAPGPTIHGTLRLDGDTTFVEARWGFDTPEPFEDAGGEVLFAPVPESDTLMHLVAVRGVFWRHSGAEPRHPGSPRSYYQEIRIRKAWVISDDHESPLMRWDQKSGSWIEYHR